MKISLLSLFFLATVSGLYSGKQALTIPQSTLEKSFNGKTAAFVLIDCTTGETFCSDTIACSEKLSPCSTFKIWNSDIGLETGVVKDPDAPFWKGDGLTGKDARDITDYILTDMKLL